MVPGKLKSWPFGCALAIMIIAPGCGSDSKTEITPYVPNGSPAACTSNIDICADITPRVEVTVKDVNGNPLQYAMVNSYYPAFSLTYVDPSVYPAKDGFGRKKSYFTCTDEQGKAMLCGWDPSSEYATSTGSDINVWRSGYLPAHYGFDPTADPVLGDGVVRTMEVALQAAADVGQTSKVLFLPCYTGDESRMTYALTYEGVAFTIPAFGQVVDALVTDPEHPLANFDTLVLDGSCSWYEPYEELLVPEKNAELWRWIAAGGRVFFGEPSSSGWTIDEASCTMEPCSSAFFPEEYRFSLMPKHRGSTADSRSCPRFAHGTIVDADHPLANGVTFDNWTYVEYRQAEATDLKYLVTWGATWRATVDESLWNVVMAVTSDQAEIDAKPGCWQDDPTLTAFNSGVALMETKYGAGSVLLVHAAWMQATNGERTGQTHAADAVALKNNIIDWILHK
jgi:hypothetical protein